VGYYFTTANGYNECRPCGVNCAICIDENTCTSCLSPYVLLNSVCADDCGDYLYPNNFNVCVPCKTSHITNANYCKDCTNVVVKGEMCGECVDPISGDMKFLGLDKTSCLDNCNLYEMEYVDNGIGVCVKCSVDKCVHCDPTNPSVCNVCEHPGWKLDSQDL
jgi:hypothetical protein